jgi:hypothetical protein
MPRLPIRHGLVHESDLSTPELLLEHTPIAACFSDTPSVTKFFMVLEALCETETAIAWRKAKMSGLTDAAKNELLSLQDRYVNIVDHCHDRATLMKIEEREIGMYRHVKEQREFYGNCGGMRFRNWSGKFDFSFSEESEEDWESEEFESVFESDSESD